MARARPTPFGVDEEKPSTARIYDYYLGGSANYRVDRETAERMIATVPDSVEAVRANREFLIRAVRFLAGEAGIDQFIDIGSGLPTRLNVHEVAQSFAPDARVVYVDYDPAVRAYGDALLATNESVRFVQQDLRRPEDILTDPAVQSLIDFDRPVAILLTGILPFIHEAEDPERIMAQLRRMVAPGSYIAVTHVLDDPRARTITATQRQSGTLAWTPRSRARIGSFFNDLEMVEPGLTIASHWHPSKGPDVSGQDEPAEVDDAKLNWLLAGIGRKP